MNSYKPIFICIIYSILIISCNTINKEINQKEYKNQKSNILKVGNQLELYAKTNSCCPYLFCHENQLSHTKFDNKEMIMLKEDCAGCTYVSAFKFTATSVGKDTIILKQVQGGVECDMEAVLTEEYYIDCLLYTSPSPRDRTRSRMPSSA